MLELLITMVVLAVALALAFPSFQNFIADGRLTAAGNDMVRAVNEARIEATKRNAVVTLAPLNGSWTEGATLQDVDGNILEQFQGDDKVTYSNSDNLAFRASGIRVDAGDWSMVICDDRGEGQRIVVGRSGSVESTKIEQGCVN